MNDKLELLLKQIALEEEFYPYFEEGSLLKIIGNRNKDTYVFFLSLKTNLPINLYTHFLDLLKKKYSDFMVNISIEVENIDTSLLPEYYRYFINVYSEKSPLLHMFLENTIEVDDSIHIVVSNLAEKMKFDSICLSLEKDLHVCGFPYSIDISIDIEKGMETLEEIHRELKAPVVLPPESKEVSPISSEGKKKFIPKDYKRPPLISDPNNEKVIVGREIDEVPVRLDTVAVAGGNVTIEGYIFADPECRETKTGLHIISLKITDFTDSIYGTLFIHDEEEFNIISKKIKKKKWYKIRAAVKDKDQYNPDISLTIRDINVLEKLEEKLVDDAPIKRVELHAHTMMSAMDGVTKLDLGKHTCELV